MIQMRSPKSDTLIPKPPLYSSPLYVEEYNKVQGLKSVKEIWDVLKTAHEGDEVTKITKREMIEGELGRFILN
jgi:hypothetical protein